MSKYLKLYKTINERMRDDISESAFPLVTYTREDKKVEIYKTKPCDYLTFTSEGDSTVQLLGASKVNIYYSFDKQSQFAQWDGSQISLTDGQCVYMYGDNPNGLNNNEGQEVQFQMTGSVYASGDIQSLLSYEYTDVIPCEHCFDGLFSRCTSLKSAPKLSAVTLKTYCYRNMFYNCTSLTQAPQLPATTLAGWCYYQMFCGCTSLTQAPELPATTLDYRCYYYMFYGCTSLTQAPELPATTLGYNCYDSMFRNCTSLTQAPQLPAITLTEYCYSCMFRNCTSLTQAPQLPAITLVEGCYWSMFEGCGTLTQAPELPATTLANSCYYGMFRDCTSLTQAPELPATTLANSCYGNMFIGCTSLTQAPQLPATTLANSCYYSMFYNCSNLLSTKENPIVINATTLAENCCKSMFEGCVKIEYAPRLRALTLEPGCYEHMFYTGNTKSALNNIMNLCITTPSDTYMKEWVKGVGQMGVFYKNPQATWSKTGPNGVPKIKIDGVDAVWEIRTDEE